MKTGKVIVFSVMATMLISSAPVFADVSLRVTTTNSPSHHRHDRGHGYHRGHGYSHHNYYRHYQPVYNSWHRPYRPVVVTPLVVTQPTYMVPPSYSSSGDYGKDLAELKEKLSRLRSVVQRQKQTGEITSEAHDRYMTSLDGIERDQLARAFDRGGNLSAEDFADLFRRLDDVSEDIERDLAS